MLRFKNKQIGKALRKEGLSAEEKQRKRHLLEMREKNLQLAEESQTKAERHFKIV